MLAGKFILRGESEFARVRQGGRMIQSDNFGISFVKKDGLSKFGFIVSNKISGSAVERNRIKRAMKEGVRKSINEVGAGLSAVFLAKPSIVRCTASEIEEEARKVLKKIV